MNHDTMLVFVKLLLFFSLDLEVESDTIKNTEVHKKQKTLERQLNLKFWFFKATPIQIKVMFLPSGN